MKPRSYNPLDYASLSETLARELMSSDLMPMSQVERFSGDGVYALFYDGDFPSYSEMTAVNRGKPGSFPIYISKACPKTMTGNDMLAGSEGGPQASSRLYGRVARDHRSSIERAVNLDIGDFACRMLVLNAIWVPITESALISRYAPLWNSILPGFGNHAPGKRRETGKLSRWDIVHPGRGRETAAQPDGIGCEELCAEAASAISERLRILGL